MAKMTSKTYRKNKAKFTKALWSDPEYRAKQSASRKAAWKRPEVRAIHSKNMSNRWKDPVFRASVSKSCSDRLKERWNNPEFAEIVKRTSSKALKRRWKSEEYRERMVKLGQKTFARIRNTPAFIKAQLKAVKEKWSDPKYKRKMAKASTEANLRNSKLHSEIMHRLHKNPEFRRKNRLKARAWAIQLNQSLGEKNPTQLEKKLYRALRRDGIKFTRQHAIPRARTIPDAFIPHLKVCIYADGDYWHSSKPAKAKDRRQAIRLRKMGFSVFRLRESTFDKDYLRLMSRITR